MARACQRMAMLSRMSSSTATSSVRSLFFWILGYATLRELPSVRLSPEKAWPLPIAAVCEVYGPLRETAHRWSERLDEMPRCYILFHRSSYTRLRISVYRACSTLIFPRFLPPFLLYLHSIPRTSRTEKWAGANITSFQTPANVSLHTCASLSGLFQ